MQEAVISAVRVAAAHEGVAELVVTLTHGNGGTSEVALDHLAANALLQSCAATMPEQLTGHSWSKVREALAVSWNRFNSN
jgi:carbonic anhydrase